MSTYLKQKLEKRLDLLAFTGVVLGGCLLMCISAFAVLHKRTKKNPTPHLLSEPTYEKDYASFSLRKDN